MPPPKNEGQKTFFEWLDVLLPEAKQIKLEPISPREKILVDQFLGHYECGIQRSLDSEMMIAGRNRDHQLKGQIMYHKAQIATIRMLRGINWQRRERIK